MASLEELISANASMLGASLDAKSAHDNPPPPYPYFEAIDPPAYFYSLAQSSGSDGLPPYQPNQQQQQQGDPFAFEMLKPEPAVNSNEPELARRLDADVESSRRCDELVSTITSDPQTRARLAHHGLCASKVTWEDTGRYKFSCFGPNISDMTLLVKGSRNTLMPVIRVPNFSDSTHDLPIDTFNLRVGNESIFQSDGIVGLRQYLREIAKYTNNQQLTGVDMSCERDTEVLTSSQCCVLPVKRGQRSEFAVQLFNYQSQDDDPAVLVIVASQHGTSTQIVRSANTKLFFNDNGEARWFEVERLQDTRERLTGKPQEKVSSFTEMKGDEKMQNAIMVIQIPLKRKQPEPQNNDFDFCCFGVDAVAADASLGFDFLGDLPDNPQQQPSSCFSFSGSGQQPAAQMQSHTNYKSSFDFCMPQQAFSNSFGFSAQAPPTQQQQQQPMFACFGAAVQQRSLGSGMDMGQLFVGSKHDRFIGTAGLRLERDVRFPIRCTFQYYRVTDANHISESDVVDIAAQLRQAASKAIASGSLVVDDQPRMTAPNLRKSTSTDDPFQKTGMPANVWNDQLLAGFL